MLPSLMWKTATRIAGVSRGVGASNRPRMIANHTPPERPWWSPSSSRSRCAEATAIETLTSAAATNIAAAIRKARMFPTREGASTRLDKLCPNSELFSEIGMIRDRGNLGSSSGFRRGKRNTRLHSLAALAAEFRVLGVEVSAVATLHPHVRSGSCGRRRPESGVPESTAQGGGRRLNRRRGLDREIAGHGSYEAESEREPPDRHQDQADRREDEGHRDGAGEGAEAAEARPVGSPGVLRESAYGQKGEDGAYDKEQESDSEEGNAEPTKASAREPKQARSGRRLCELSTTLHGNPRNKQRTSDDERSDGMPRCPTPGDSHGLRAGGREREQKARSPPRPISGSMRGSGRLRLGRPGRRAGLPASPPALPTPSRRWRP